MTVEELVESTLRGCPEDFPNIAAMGDTAIIQIIKEKRCNLATAMLFVRLLEQSASMCDLELGMHLAMIYVKDTLGLDTNRKSEDVDSLDVAMTDSVLQTAFSTQKGN